MARILHLTASDARRDAENFDATAEAPLDELAHASRYGAAARARCSTEFPMAHLSDS